MDLFSDVMADIGDLQSVDGDLSTFSGHLVMCREMMRTINTRKRSSHEEDEEEDDIFVKDSSSSSSSSSGGSGSGSDGMDGFKHPYFLILLDEIGTGTDPNQVRYNQLSLSLYLWLISEMISESCYAHMVNVNSY